MPRYSARSDTGREMARQTVGRIQGMIIRVVRMLEENPDDVDYAIFELEDIAAYIDESMRVPDYGLGPIGSRMPRRESAREYTARTGKKAKRKESAWNKFVRTNSKKAKYRYKSGKNKGKLNLRKMGIDYRKTTKKKRR